MLNFVQVQASGPWGLRPGGKAKILTTPYDLPDLRGLSLTQKLGKRERFAKVSC